MRVPVAGLVVGEGGEVLERLLVHIELPLPALSAVGRLSPEEVLTVPAVAHSGQVGQVTQEGGIARAGGDGRQHEAGAGTEVGAVEVADQVAVAAQRRLGGRVRQRSTAVDGSELSQSQYRSGTNSGGGSVVWNRASAGQVEMSNDTVTKRCHVEAIEQRVLVGYSPDARIGCAGQIVVRHANCGMRVALQEQSTINSGSAMRRVVGGAVGGSGAV